VPSKTESESEEPPSRGRELILALGALGVVLLVIVLNMMS
jgi:hypothetical protein